MGLHEVRVGEVPKDNGVKLVNITYKLGDVTCWERLVYNADGSVRGRIVRFTKNDKFLKSIAFKGYSKAWCTELHTENGIEIRKPNGNIMFREIIEGDGSRCVNAAGTEISKLVQDRWGNEIAHYLFGEKLVEQE